MPALVISWQSYLQIRMILDIAKLSTSPSSSGAELALIPPPIRDAYSFKMGKEWLSIPICKGGGGVKNLSNTFAPGLVDGCIVDGYSTHSSILWRLWHPTRWSRLWSVMRGQLSSSNTVRFSLAQGDMPRCLIASSVINSQWESERDSRQGQCTASCDIDVSVIRTHSSRSIRSNLWQDLARACRIISLIIEAKLNSSMLGKPA